MPARSMLTTFHGPQGPWALATVAAVACGVALTYAVENIETTLQSAASGVLERFGADAARVRVDGRDLELEGLIDTRLDRQALVDALASVDGVRLVRDEAGESDPAEQRRLETLAFRRELEALDASAIIFDSGSIRPAPSAMTVLDRLVTLMQTYPRARVRIAGHTDSSGQANANLRISRDRARAVAEYLVEGGIRPDRVVAQGYGDTQPIADNGTESGRAANRRIDFTYID